MSSAQDWCSALDELERTVSVGLAAEETDGAWVAPTGLGPMPVDLIDRAEALAQQMTVFEVEMRRRQREITDELAALRRRARHVTVQSRSSGLDALA